MPAAVGLRVLRESVRSKFVYQFRLGAQALHAGLGRLAAQYCANDVHDRGMLVALTLPAPVAGAVVEPAMRNGLLNNAPLPCVLRFMSALNVTTDEIEQGLALLDCALGEVLQKSTT